MAIRIKLKLFFILLFGSLVTSVVSFAIHSLRSGDKLEWVGNWLQNFGTELLGALITFVLLDMVLSTAEQKDRLFSDLGSHVNDIARYAAERLKAKGLLNLEKIYLAEANLSRADLRGLNFHSAMLDDAKLNSANLDRVNLSEAYLTKSDLSGASLRKADLSKAMLTHANLKDCNLADSSLRDATLTDAQLTNADLRGADLSGANAFGADFSNTNLSNANLRGTQFIHTNLKGAIVTQEQLDTAATLIGVVLPNGVQLPDFEAIKDIMDNLKSTNE